MKKSGKIDDRRKSVTKLKTFPVPFNLIEIEESASFTTNDTSTTYRNQIINQAIKFHIQGNFKEASRYYQYCLSQGFNDTRVFCNYGDILKNLGKLKEAEILTRKALELDANLIEAHSNLGIILKGIGKLKEAEL